MYFYSIPNSTLKFLYSYNICSTTFHSDIPIDNLSPFLEKKTKGKYSSKNPPLNNQDDYVLIYKGPGAIGDSVREISFYKSKNSYKLIIQDVGKFLINKNSEDIEIYLLESEISLKDKLIIESLLGPVIIFCLALYGISCFHASAVEYKNQAILFLGKSGSGKSTLADYLVKNSDGKIKRIADDIVPITFIDNLLFALPRFPQLKLPNKQQYHLSKPSKVNISAIYLLKKDNRKKSVDTHDFEPYQRILSLISNTVASRLFDKELNQQHLEFCNQISSLIPINIISYPHKLDILPEVKNRISEDISNFD